MRWACLLSIGLLVSGGCARYSSGEWPQTEPTGTKPRSIIVTPTQATPGKISSVNPSARYVVITFPVGVPLPAVDRRLNVYRAGLKVAEIQVGKEQVDVNAIADIVAGECRVGDEVREN